MANTIQHKRGTATPAGAISRGELAIQEVSQNYTTSSSSKLWIGEGSTPNLRQLGFGIYDGSTQSGVPLGGNLTFTGGTAITTTVDGAGVTHAVTAGSIGNTQLAYNTGQHLTTSSSPTFSALTLSGDLAVNGGDITSDGGLDIGGDSTGDGNDSKLNICDDGFKFYDYNTSESEWESFLWITANPGDPGKINITPKDHGNAYTDSGMNNSGLVFENYSGRDLLTVGYDHANVVSIKAGPDAAGSLRIYEDSDNGTNYTGFKAPASVTTTSQYTLPAADGTPGYQLTTDGNGTLSWAVSGDSYSNWTLAADSGSSQTITSGNTVSILGTAPISTTASSTDTVTIAVDTGGITDTHLAYNTGQHLTTTSNPTFGYATFNIDGDNMIQVLKDGEASDPELINFQTTNCDGAQVFITCYDNGSAKDAELVFRTSDGSLASPLVVDENEDIGTLLFQAYDGDEFLDAARISVKVPHENSGADEYEPSNNNMPAEMHFFQNRGANNGDLQVIPTLSLRQEHSVAIRRATSSSCDARLHVGGNIKAETISAATSDLDKFLVSDGGEIKYRTGAEVASDIGALALDSISVGSEGSASGDGAIAYNNSTGVFTYTPPVHDSLSGFAANEHIDHSGVSITAGTGLTGGGTIASTRTLNVNTDDSSLEVDGNSGELQIKASGVTNAMLHGSIATSKITSGTFANGRISSGSVTQHVGDIVHDSLSGFEAAEHIDWTADQGSTNIHTGNYTAGEANVDTDLSKTVSGTGYSINSSTGDNIALSIADTNNWGLMSDEMFDTLAALDALTLSGSNTGDESDASATVKGIVELATTGETTTGTDTARAVTPAGVQAAIDALVASAPGALDTLNELAAAIGDDASYATTVTNALGAKAAIAGPTFTGIVTTPDLTLTDLSNQGSEATAVMVNGSNVVGTRELGSNAFNSTAFTTNTGTVTSVGTNTGLSGTVTSSGSLSLDLDSLADMTQAWVNGTDEFIVLDDGTQKKKLSSEIFGSNAFNSTAFTTNTGTVTSVATSGGLSGGTITSSGTITTTGVLQDLNTLGAPASDGQFIVATGSGAFAYESTSTARTSLGLGTAATRADSYFATGAEGDLATAAMPKAGGTFTGDITMANGEDILGATEGGSDLGAADNAWGSIYVADHKYLHFGDDYDIAIGNDTDINSGDHANGLTITSTAASADLNIYAYGDGGDPENEDLWRLKFADGGTYTMANRTSGSYVTKMTLTTGGNLTASGTVDGANFTIGGAQGSDGQVLTSTGAGVAWETVSAGGGGDITSVVAGSGMTGGATSGAATLNVIGGTGITANADDIALTNGLIADGSNITSLGTLTTLTVDDITINGSTISDSGDFTIDVGGDIEINADGGQIHIKDSTKAQFTFDCDTTTFKIYDEAPSNAHSDYGYIKTVTTANPTNILQLEIGIVDASGSVETKPDCTLNDILITCPEDLKLNAGGGEIQFHEDGVEIAAMANPSSNVHIMSMGGTPPNTGNGVGIRYNAGEMEYRNSDHSSSTWTTFDSLSGGGGSFDPGSVEESMISDTNDTDDLGSSGIAWKDLYLSGDIVVDGVAGVTGSQTVVTDVVLLPGGPGIYSIDVTYASFTFASGILTRVM